MNNRTMVSIAITCIDGDRPDQRKKLAEMLERRLTFDQTNGIGVFSDDTVDPLFANTAMTVIVEER